MKSACPALLDPTRVHGLDMLRTAAIMLVLISHGRLLLEPFLPSLHVLTLGGYWGVELFFVLSGFLIGRILLRAFQTQGHRAWWVAEFWKRRWFRTVPNYVLFLTVNILLGGWFGPTWDGDWRYLIFAQNFFGEHPSFFGEAWSLAVEEWFYLLAPLSLLAWNRIMSVGTASTRILYWIVGTIVALNAMRVGVVLWADPAWDAGVRKVTALRLDAIMCGVLWAWVRTYRDDVFARVRVPAAWLGAGLLVLSAALYWGLDRDASVYARTLYFSHTGVAFSLLLPWCASIQHKRGLWGECCERISLMSYSMYLFHYSFWLFGLRALWRPESLGSAVLATAVFWAGVLTVPWAVFRWYELPMMRLRDRTWPGAGRAWKRMVAALAAVVGRGVR